MERLRRTLGTLIVVVGPLVLAGPLCSGEECPVPDAVCDGGSGKAIQCNTDDDCRQGYQCLLASDGAPSEGAEGYCAKYESDTETDTGSSGEEIHLTDPVGDQVCAYDPAAEPPPATDIVAHDIVAAAGGVDCITTMNGDVQAYEDTTTEKLPFMLQIWLLDGTYIEVFFTDKGVIKVVDGVVEADYVLDETKIIFHIQGISLEEILGTQASTSVYSSEWTFECEDDVGVNVP